MSIDLYTMVDGKLVPSKASVFTFPGGERHIKYTPGDLSNDEYALVRGADANDLIALAMWTKCVRVDGGLTTAIIPYLPAARSDRGTPTGAMFYSELIRMAFPGRLICLDPHSRMMPDFMDSRLAANQIVEITASDIVEKALNGFKPDFVIVPDEGAKARALSVALRFHVPLVYARKKRDFETGKLTGFEIDAVPETGHGLIVDDICDAGGTFLGVASASGLASARLSLFVSHGIFSGNGKRNWDLQDAFDYIYTTDSHHKFPILPQQWIDGPEHPYNLVVSDVLQLLEPYL